MNYIMKSGCLCNEQSGEALAKIKSSFSSPSKRIQLSEINTEYHTDIRKPDAPTECSSDVRLREYYLGNQGNTVMTGRPGYAEGEDPLVTGWPICRLPRVDHAQIRIGGNEYHLAMHNSQNYTLKDKTGYVILQIMHRGLIGGWLFCDDHGFTPEILCGLFVFCRYIEQENEFLLV